MTMVIFHVEKDAGVIFIAETRVPPPLLVEHDSTLEIGQVLKLQALYLYQFLAVCSNVVTAIIP